MIHYNTEQSLQCNNPDCNPDLNQQPAPITLSMQMKSICQLTWQITGSYAETRIFARRSAEFGFEIRDCVRYVGVNQLGVLLVLFVGASVHTEPPDPFPSCVGDHFSSELLVVLFDCLNQMCWHLHSQIALSGVRHHAPPHWVSVSRHHSTRCQDRDPQDCLTHPKQTCIVQESNKQGS